MSFFIFFTAVDAVALIVQIHLQQNRNDLAVKEVTAAKRWAQDNIIVNLAESWVGLRLVRLYTIPSYLYQSRNTTGQNTDDSLQR